MTKTWSWDLLCGWFFREVQGCENSGNQGLLDSDFFEGKRITSLLGMGKNPGVPVGNGLFRLPHDLGSDGIINDLQSVDRKGRRINIAPIGKAKVEAKIGIRVVS